jgi:outer membrane protein assembly factor BamD (BamD/ComL family)
MFHFMILLLLAALCGANSWEYRAGGFINLSTGETKAPEAFLALGEKLHAEHRFDEAAEAMAILTASPVDLSLRERALILRSRALADGGEPTAAYEEYNRYLTAFPESPRVAAVREEMMKCALAKARQGDLQTILGIPMYRSSRNGIKLMRDTLLRFSREECTDDYYLRLAAYFQEEGDSASAEAELTLILENYPASDSAPRALLLRARIRRDRFDAIHYDLSALVDAKRDYEMFVGDYLRYGDEPERLRSLGLDAARLQAMATEARDGIRFVTAKLAEKELALARFYVHRGRPKSAAVYLDYILRNFGDTPTAPEAKRLLETLRK